MGWLLVDRGKFYLAQSFTNNFNFKTFENTK